MAEIPQARVVVVKEITTRRNLRAFGQGSSEHTLAKFERSFQLGRFRCSYPWNGTELFDSTLSEARKSVKTSQYFKADLHRGRPLATDSKKNGQQLSISQRSWPLCEQSFTWTFCFRP